ncbi:MAG: signal transduction histidine kinase/ActR/RegA family two-component response regulator [Alteromonadaceae bacterium]|jgi:signal transduction histidine kinase/ActR/RegA family two-component response regulator
MTSKSLFIKIFSFIPNSLLHLLFIFPMVSEGANLKHELNVVIHNDHHPISFELPDGRPAGLYVDLWNLWAVTTGTPVNFISSNYEDGMLMVKSHKAVHSGLFKNATRQQWADFSVPIHRVESSILYNKQGDKKNTLHDFDGLKVAVVPGAYHERYILDNYPNITVVPFRGTASINDLIKNDIQAIFNESPALQSLLAKMGLGAVLESTIVEDMSSLVHAVVAKGQSSLLKEINSGFKNIPIQALVVLEKKWLPNTSPFFSSKAPLEVLTLAERDWLQTHTTFSLGIDQHSYPFEFIDDNNKFSGISSDYIDFISQQLNIKLNVVKDMTWAQSLEALKAGEIDVMSSMVRTRKREESMLFTKSYFQLPSVAVTKKGGFYAESMSSFNDKKVGVIKGYVFAELITQDHPGVKVVYVSSAVEGLRLLNDGQLDGYIGALPIVNHEIDKERYYNLIVASFTPYKLQLSMAVRLGLEPLIPILNKALDSMDVKSKSMIANNWLAVRIQQGTELKTILKWAIPILTGLILIIFSFMAVNRKLKREIKQRQLLEGQLLQSQKMKALGEMAGGIAHDFNNIMGIIIGNSELLSIKFPKDQTIQKFNNNIFNASTRATELVSQIMTFSRMSKAPLNSVNFSDVIHECVQLIKSTAPENINILYNMESGYDYVVKGDKTQINQVLLNLCTNAIDAMSPNSGLLELTLSGSNIAVPSGLSAANGYFSLKVKDSGAGIDHSIIKNIFDPFFSTKEVGKGTGLGLSVVYNIINGHDGNISVVNNDNNGVEFTILLPKTLDAPLHKKAKILNARKGQGNILIAEDEEDLRRLYCEHLESSGYVVTTCENGYQALVLFKDNPNGYDLILTDHSMPLMTGTELIEAVLKIRVDIPIVLATGYADIGSIDKVVSKNAYKCLVKPIKRNVLLETVYRCIESKDT